MPTRFGTPYLRGTRTTERTVPRWKFDIRAAGTWDEPAGTQTTTVCAACGVGRDLSPHVQDNEVVEVTPGHNNP